MDSGPHSTGEGVEDADPVLRTFYAETFRNSTAVVQAFAGRVELSVVESVRSRYSVVSAEFPSLPPAWCRLLADNIDHAARIDPYRLPQMGDTPEGGAVLAVPGAVFTTQPIKGMPGFSRLTAISNAVGDTPGELFALPCMRTTSAVSLARALRIAATVAEGLAAYETPALPRKADNE